MALQQTILNVALGLGLGHIAQAATRRHLRILCYHGIWVTPGARFGNCTFIEPLQFEQRMARLKRTGLTVLPLGEAIERLERDDLPDRAVAITIDDGWVSTFTHMLPVLEGLELPATLYATTWYLKHRLPVVNVAVDYLHFAANRPKCESAAAIARIEALPVDQRLAALRALGDRLGVAEDWYALRQFELVTSAELAEAHRRGLDIQLHTHRHIDVTAHHDLLPQEIAENRAALTAAIGEANFGHFCYPSGSFHREAPASLAQNGIRSAALCVPGLNAPGCDLMKLRRFLDGRDVSDIQFESYLSGMLQLLSRAVGRHSGP
jgi:peptidoglycan/xylan/chitin deacetylase (PgdA/CDA1 family)